MALPAAVLPEPVPNQGEKALADQGQATVLAEPVAAQRDGQEGEESDVRVLEVQMGRESSALPDEAVVLPEPVADEGDGGGEDELEDRARLDQHGEADEDELTRHLDL